MQTTLEILLVIFIGIAFIIGVAVFIDNRVESRILDMLDVSCYVVEDKNNGYDNV